MHPVGIETDNLRNEFIQIKEKSPKVSKVLPNIHISYTDFIANKMNLKKFKLPELKSIAKNLRLFITGSKSILIERIETYFNKVSNSIKIQKIFRGYIVRKSFELRGDAFKNKALCVNNTDFYTLEPLDEINFELFYSYKDSKNFHYGFNITSLIKLMKNKTNQILNPYNREIISKNEIKSISSLYKKIYLLFSSVLEPEDVPPTVNPTPINQPPRSNTLYINLQHANLIREVTNKITEIRNKEINVRINQLFMEIDQLGNYTCAEWFFSLNVREYVRLYRTLYDIWNYRAELSREIKQKICILNDPFFNIFNERIYYNDVSLQRIQEACLIVFENLVFTGIDIEYRKLGAIHALTALTVVSQNARNSMPWLYESIQIL